MLSIAQAKGVPVAIAAIPARLTADAVPLILASSHCEVLQHGIAHENHAPADEKSCELGAHRPLGVTADGTLARSATSRICVRRSLPAGARAALEPDSAGGRRHASHASIPGIVDVLACASARTSQRASRNATPTPIRSPGAWDAASSVPTRRSRGSHRTFARAATAQADADRTHRTAHASRRLRRRRVGVRRAIARDHARASGRGRGFARARRSRQTRRYFRPISMNRR